MRGSREPAEPIEMRPRATYLTKAELIERIHSIRRVNCCAYAGNDPCDCKFARPHRSAQPYGRENGCGCAELRVIASWLDKLPERVLRPLLKRMSWWMPWMPGSLHASVGLRT